MEALPIALHFLVGGEFAAWLEQQSPSSQVLELVELLRRVRAEALLRPVPPIVVRPLLEALLGNAWLVGQWMPLAAHHELEEAATFLASLQTV